MPTLLDGDLGALFHAVRVDNVPAVTVLVNMGCNAFAPSKFNGSPFLRALDCHQWPIVKIVLAHAPPGDNWLTVPISAKRQGEETVCATVLMALLRVAATPLDIIQWVVDCGANVNARARASKPESSYEAWAPVHFAAQHSLAAVLILVERGADISATNSPANTTFPNPVYESALFAACAAGKVDVAEYLLANGATVTPFGAPPLFAITRTISQSAKVAEVELLTAHGADANSVHVQDGRNPTSVLWKAVTNDSDVPVARCLLDHGASFRSGWTRVSEKPGARGGELLSLFLAHGWIPETFVLTRDHVVLRSQHRVARPGEDYDAGVIMSDVLRYLHRLLSPDLPQVVTYALQALFPNTAQTLDTLMTRIDEPLMRGAIEYMRRPHERTLDRLARIVTTGLALGEQYQLKPDPRVKPNSISVMDCPPVRYYLPLRLVPHCNTPLAFRRASRALALLRFSSHADASIMESTSDDIALNRWGELPLELFEVVLDELFQLERDARALV